MTHVEKNIETLLADVLHQFAFELDANYENETMRELVRTDSTFTTFRNAVQELRKRQAPLSDRVLHVERRIEAAAEAGEGGA